MRQECVQWLPLIVVRAYMHIKIIILACYQLIVKVSLTSLPECVYRTVHKPRLKSILVYAKLINVCWYVQKYLIILVTIQQINANIHVWILVKLETFKTREDVSPIIIVQDYLWPISGMLLQKLVWLLWTVQMEHSVIIIQWFVKVIVQDPICIMLIL